MYKTHRHSDYVCANDSLLIVTLIKGRTNKLVDGCYSFWQGACFTLLGKEYIGHNAKEGPHWLFDQLSLQEYIIICCQHPSGGLIDKPGKYVQ